MIVKTKNQTRAIIKEDDAAPTNSMGSGAIATYIPILNASQSSDSNKKRKKVILKRDSYNA